MEVRESLFEEVTYKTRVSVGISLNVDKGE